MTRREVAARTVATAVDYLSEVLADGPMPCGEVKTLAERDLGFHVGEREWQTARERAGVASERVGTTWWWSLRSSTLTADLSAWLDSPHGHFAEHLAQRERAPRQLTLETDAGGYPDSGAQGLPGATLARLDGADAQPPSEGGE
jgi:hypothetical protein